MTYNLYNCGKLFFQPGMIPDYRSFGSLFSSRTNSQTRIINAVWDSAIPIPVSTKKEISIALSERISVFTTTEVLGNLLILSMIHRFLSILVASAKIYIDNMDINFSKNSKNKSYSHKITKEKSKAELLIKPALSAAISMLPALFLIYIVGYPPTDLIYNTCITQAVSSTLSYFSLKAGNFLRNIDLISESKLFNKSSYLSKIAISSTIDIALTFLWHGKAIITDPFKLRDNYNVVNYCYSEIDYNILTTKMINTPLISIMDKFVWQVGRVLFDSLVITANKYGIIRDIRSPFITNFQNSSKKTKLFERIKEALEKKVVPEEKIAKRKQQSRDDQQKSPKTKSDSNGMSPATQFLLSDTPSASSSITHRVKEKTKTKGEPDPQRLEEMPEIDRQDAQITTEIQVGELTFYRISGSRIPKNTWGVITYKKQDQSINAHETSLRSGHAGNRNSAIKKLTNGSFEIRPKSQGSRLIGPMKRGFAGFRSLFPLGQAMEIYDQFKEAGGKENEVHIIDFSRRSKHEDIGKAR